MRAIARSTGFHRATVAKILAENSAGPVYRRRGRPRGRPKLGPFLGVIEAMLDSDRQAPRKQRHTAKRIFERLRDEHGYRGCVSQVRAYVAQARNLRQAAFVPLQFGPGEAQVDWGEAWVLDADGAERKAHLFVMTFPFSDARFVAAFPRESLEFFLEGHVRGFRFFGGVPRRIVYDNLRSAVAKVGRGHRRQLSPAFESFAARHLFTPAFCNVAQGHEKGHVENGVGWARRNLFVPRPQLADWGAFNAQLAERCAGQWPQRLRGHEQTIGERLDEDRAQLLPIPALDPRATARPQTVSSLCLARFDTNDYSVPCRYAHHRVTVAADVARVRIFHQERCIAEHARCHAREQAVYEPWHYLALIERRPLALDYGAPMKRLELLERERKGAERRLRAAQFPAPKSLEDFDFLAAPGVNKQQVLELSRSQWIDQRQNLIFLGNPGTGKTHLAVALGARACQRGYNVRFTTAAALVNALVEARDERTLLRLQAKLAKIQLLIVDELGYVPFAKTGAELLFEAFSQRYERGSVLITSNLPFEEWTQVFGSERLTGALLDRLTHRAHILPIEGDSYRLAQRRRKHTKKDQGGSTGITERDEETREVTLP